MPALVNAVRSQTVALGTAAVVNTGLTSSAINITDYEGIIAITEVTGTVAGSGVISTALQFSATSGGSYAGKATYGNADFTASKGTSGTVETIYVDTNAVPGWMKIVTTLVSGTSVNTAHIITGVKKVQ